MTEVLLRLVLDEEDLAKWHAEYADDIEWYRANDQLNPDHPDSGYATGVPRTLEQYRQEMLAGILEELVGARIGYHVERVEPSE